MRLRTRLQRLIQPGIRPDTPRPRTSSLPFVSGDTFRCVAEAILEAQGTTWQRDLTTSVIFSDTASACEAGFTERLREAKEALSRPEAASLVIHNGDRVPDASVFKDITRIVPRVFSKNILDGIPGVTPIPIGLENVSLNHNGKLHYYLDELQHPTPPEKRNRLVLSSFHVSTNPELREQARHLLKASRHGHEDTFAKSLDYRLEVRRTKFVISPPGNGMDCHRTWEAIYLGAVPVVLEGYLAKSLIRSAPILEVKSFEDFCSLTDDQLEQLYLGTRVAHNTAGQGLSWLAKLTSPPRH